MRQGVSPLAAAFPPSTWHCSPTKELGLTLNIFTTLTKTPCATRLARTLNIPHSCCRSRVHHRPSAHRPHTEPSSSFPLPRPCLIAIGFLAFLEAPRGPRNVMTQVSTVERLHRNNRHVRRHNLPTIAGCPAMMTLPRRGMVRLRAASDFLHGVLLQVARAAEAVAGQGYSYDPLRAPGETHTLLGTC